MRHHSLLGPVLSRAFIFIGRSAQEHPCFHSVAREGWLSPDRREPEGPFREWTGHYTGSSEPVPAMDIERIYHRHNPIHLGVLIATGLPDLEGVWAHEVGGGSRGIPRRSRLRTRRGRGLSHIA